MVSSNSKMNREIVRQCMIMEKTYRTIFEEIRYHPGGILPSELLAFCACLDLTDTRVLIESGRSLGFSTEVLAEFCELHRIKFLSIDQSPEYEADKRLDRFDCLSLEKGDGRSMIPGLVAGHRLDRCAVLCDGPKGLKALEVIESCINRITVGAIHDTSKKRFGKNGTEDNPVRVHLEDNCQNLTAFFTDDEDFVNEFEHLDERCWKNEYSSRREFTAGGFTLAIFRGLLWERNENE